MANRHPHHIKHAGMHSFSVKRTSNPAVVRDWLAFTDARGFAAPYKVQVSYRRSRMEHIEVCDVAAYQ